MPAATGMAISGARNSATTRLVAVSTTPIEPATPSPLKTFGNTVSAPSDVVH